MHETDWRPRARTSLANVIAIDLHIFLYELVDNELTDEDCSRLKRHISECPACAEKVAAETALREILHCCACDAPKSLRDKIRGELSSRNE